MNKRFAEFLTSMGMTVKGKYAYGVIKGYETSACTDVYCAYFAISFYESEDTKNKIKEKITQIKQQLRIVQVVPTMEGITIAITGWTTGQIIKKLPETLDAIYAVLDGEGCLGSEYCPICGKKLEEGTFRDCEIGNTTVRMHETCVDDINQKIDDSDREFADAPSNLLKGTLGALIGGAVGVIITVIMFFIGYISAIPSVVSVMLGAFLYKKFGGKPNAVMIIIVSVISLASMLLTIFGLYVLTATAIVQENAINRAVSAMEAFNICMQDAEFSKEFTSNMLMTLFFSVLGIALEIFTLVKQIKRQKKIG